jgi:hypothetical protein
MDDAFTFIAALGSLGAAALIAASLSRDVYRQMQERARKQKLDKFVGLLTKPENSGETNKYFTGEIALEEEVYVFIPIEADTTKVEEFARRIDSLVFEAKLGKVMSVYQVGEFHGVDILLVELIDGLDVILTELMAAGMPPGTFIEYAGGDLHIYDAS